MNRRKPSKVRGLSRGKGAFNAGKTSSPIASQFDVAPPPLLPLSEEEKQDLEHHEDIIGKGWEVFVNVGQSLAAIRDGRLYREQYGSFHEYCRLKWQFHKSYAYYLINASEIVEYLGGRACQD